MIPGDIIFHPLFYIFPEIFIIERIVVIMKTLGSEKLHRVYIGGLCRTDHYTALGIKPGVSEIFLTS